MSARDTVDTVQRPLERPLITRAPAARLVVVFPRALLKVVPLVGGAVVLGRKPGDGVQIDDATVSRRHLEVGWDAERRAHVARDLGSRNGSRVDGRTRTANDEPALLVDGSVARFGDVIAVYECGPAVEALDGADVSREAVPGGSAAAAVLRARVAAAASDPSPVLLVGETGVGKEFVAREIHRLGGRRGAFVPVNCAALSPQLVESQLFGHKKGAFTGADSNYEGVFRAADGGSLFLDEVGELPRELQPKLLRALQENEVQPVGASHPVPVDVRIVAATLCDLGAMAQSGGFRLDLYARLSLWEIQVPPLRQRRVDILDWLELLEQRWHERRGRPARPLALDADTAERVLLHDWVDNLRGLDRVVHRFASDPASGLFPAAAATTTSTDVIRTLPQNEAPPPDVLDDVDDDERAPRRPRRPPPSRDELVRALDQHGGSVRATAKHFDRERRQIYRWMEHYGIKEKK